VPSITLCKIVIVVVIIIVIVVDIRDLGAHDSTIPILDEIRQGLHFMYHTIITTRIGYITFIAVIIALHINIHALHTIGRYAVVYRTLSISVQSAV
jgi:hypothetical protein